MNNLIASQVAALATTFAQAVVSAIRGASIADLHDLAAEGPTATPRRGPGRPRKSTAVPTPATTAPAAKARGRRTAAAPTTRKTRTTAPKVRGRLPRRSTADIAKALAK